MKALWIKPFSEGDHLVRFDCDAAKFVDGAFEVVLKVAIVDGVRKGH